MTSGTVILLTGLLAAVACSLLGTFLILRRMAMMTDAISHAILPGLVGGYWLANSPNLLVGAAGATPRASRDGWERCCCCGSCGTRSCPRTRCWV